MPEMPEMMNRAREVLEQLLAKMNLAAEVVATEDEERITLEVKGPETGIVIGKRGQTLDALQYLVNKIVSTGREDDGKPIQVDAEGYRGRRAEALVEMAHKLADKARKTGRPVIVDPMSPAERRVIHVTLAEAEGVTTRSEGEGIHRHLVIIPTAGRPSPAE